MPKYIDIEKEINEMEQVLEDHKDDTSLGSGVALGAFRLFIDELKRVPEADVKPVAHARWLYDNYPYAQKCSNCKYETNVNDEYLFCPRCGAKMDEKG